MGTIIIICLIGVYIAPGDSIGALLSREVFWWIFAAVVLTWLAFVERLPLTSIGFRWPTWKTFLFALAGAAAVLFVMILHMGVIVRVFHLDTTTVLAQQRMILSKPYWFRVLLVLRAAVVEEVVFRGYMIEKVRQLTGNGFAYEYAGPTIERPGSTITVSPSRPIRVCSASINS